MTWLPGYETDPEPGAGHNPLPGRRKVILHTTETPRGSWGAVRDLWRGPANWARGLPHFLADGDRYVQLLPLDTCAYTSKGGPDSANKTGTPIQVEIVGYAADGLDDDEYEALGQWIADLVRAGVDLDLDHCPRFYGDREGVVLAVETSPVRQIITNDYGGFAAFNGVCGHQHLRGNDHWDPGHLDIHRVCDIARRHLSGPGMNHSAQQEDELTMATLDQVRGIVRDEIESALRRGVGRSFTAERDGAIYEVFPGAGVARHLSPEAYEEARKVVEHVGTLAAPVWDRFVPIEGSWFEPADAQAKP